MIARTKEALRRVVASLRRLGVQPTLIYPKLDNGYTVDPDSDTVACDAARRAGFDVIHARPNELSLDLDDGAEINPRVFLEIQTHFPEYEVFTWPSKSGKGSHVLFRFKGVKFTEGEALALECALGSDPVRTAANVIRVKKNMSFPRYLFRKKETPVTQGLVSV